MDALAAHHDVAALGGELGAGERVFEVGGSTGGIVLHADTLVREVHAVGAGALNKGVKQHHLQVAAMDGELRPVVAAVAAGRVRIDELPEAVVVGDLAGGDADVGQRLLEPELGQFLGGVRQKVDADAERPDLGHRLVDAAGDAGRVQS